MSCVKSWKIFFRFQTMYSMLCRVWNIFILNSRLCRVENLRAPIPDYVFHAMSCVKSLSDSRLCIPCYRHSEISHFSIPDYVELSIPCYVFQTMYSHRWSLKWLQKKINRKFHVATEIGSTFFGCWSVTGQLKKENMIFYHQYEISNR
jgi:hypothetical protein